MAATNLSGGTGIRCFPLDRLRRHLDVDTGIESSLHDAGVVCRWQQARCYGGHLSLDVGRPGHAPATTTGTGGALSGGQYSAVDLQYIGNGQWIILDHQGILFVK